LSARGRAVLAVAGIVAVAFNMRTAIAGIPPLLDDLGLGAAGQSLLVTIPVLCFAVGALAGPRLRARLGEERAIFAVLVASVAGIVLRAAWPDAALLPGTVVAGLGIAGLNVLLPSLIKRRFRDHVGPLTAAYTTTLSIGGGVAAAVTVPVLDAADGAPGIALGIWALPALAALVVWLPQLRLAGGTVRGPAVRRGDARAMWGQPLAWLVMLFMGLQSVTFYGPLSWLPAILRDNGVDATEAGVLLGVMTMISMVGSTISPVVAVRRPDQRGVVAASVAISAVGLLGLLLAPASAPLLWAVLLGLGQGACFGLALLLIVLRAADGEAAARLSSMAQAGGYVVAAAGPLAMGLLHALTGSWTAPLLFLLAACAAQLVAGLGAARDRLVRHEHAMS
jgi:CP family cyanate transporter-like MFS transporter